MRPTGNWNVFMIIETIFSTINEAGEPNFAPMGLIWSGESALVRPFRDTQTYRNLRYRGCGVANFCDDVLAYVQCGLYDSTLEFFPARAVPGIVYRGACSWLELEVISQNGSEERADFHCRVLRKGWQRDFLGFCRASNAVIEAAILATRLALYDRKKVEDELIHYLKIVEKTGGEKEKQAFQLIQGYIRKREGE
jgi:hypothetical protein